MGSQTWGSILGLGDRDLRRRQMLNGLSHPGAPSTLHFLIEDFSPLTFKVIINKHVIYFHCVPCSWVEKINVVKMSIPPKAIHRFSAVPTKIPNAFFKEIEQIIPKFVWNHKKLSIVKKNLEEEQS